MLFTIVDDDVGNWKELWHFKIFLSLYFKQEVQRGDQSKGQRDSRNGHGLIDQLRGKC